MESKPLFLKRTSAVVSYYILGQDSTCHTDGGSSSVQAILHELFDNRADVNDNLSGLNLMDLDLLVSELHADASGRVFRWFLPIEPQWL